VPRFRPAGAAECNRDKVAIRAKRNIAGLMLGPADGDSRAISGRSFQVLRATLGGCLPPGAEKANERAGLSYWKRFRPGREDTGRKPHEKLDRIEHDTDFPAIKLRSDLFKIEKDLPPIKLVMFLYQSSNGSVDVAGPLPKRVGIAGTNLWPASGQLLTLQKCTQKEYCPPLNP